MKCDNLRFEAASGDVMPYVSDLVVRLKIGTHVVNTLWKIMATMPDGHLPILGVRGQRCMNGDILNSIGQFPSCLWMFPHSGCSVSAWGAGRGRVNSTGQCSIW